MTEQEYKSQKPLGALIYVAIFGCALYVCAGIIWPSLFHEAVKIEFNRNAEGFIILSDCKWEGGATYNCTMEAALSSKRSVESSSHLVVVPPYFFRAVSFDENGVKLDSDIFPSQPIQLNQKYRGSILSSGQASDIARIEIVRE